MDFFTGPLTDTSFLVILLPAFLALITVLIGRSRAGFAGLMASCMRRWIQNSESRHIYYMLLFSCILRRVIWGALLLGQCAEVYLCTERRCRSSLRWSSRRCSPGRTPLRNRGHSCTFRSLSESRRHRTSRFHDRVCQSPPHRLQRIKSAQIQTPFH